MKFMLLLFALVVGIGNAWADDTYVKVTSTSQLTAGSEYLIVYENGNSSAACGAISTTSTKYGTSIPVAVSSSSITITNQAVVSFVLGGSSNAWTFNFPSSNYYLTWSSGNSLDKKEITGNTTLSNNEKWTISISNGTTTITNNATSGNNTRYIKYNTASNSLRFACYTSGQADISLYKKSTGGGTTYTVTYNKNGGNEITGTVPTDSHSYSSSDNTVTVAGNTGNLAKPGHTWSGWCLNATGTGTVYGPGDGQTHTYTIPSSTTFYAKWTTNQYNVALSSNDKATLTATYGTNSTINEGGNANVDYGTVITLNATSMPTGAECVWQIKKASDNSDVTSSVLSNGNKLTVPDYAVIIGASISTKAVYTITTTSAVSSSGTAPSESSATFSQTYTTAKQMTANNSMTLTLKGYEGQMIKAITLSMKSNSSGGAGYMTATAGTTTIGSIASENDSKPFDNAVWNGSFSTSYVNITVPIVNPDNVVLSDLVIYIKASANSLYCESFTIYYETSTDPIVALTPSSLSATYEEHINVSGFTVKSVNIETPSYSLVSCDAEGNTITKPDWFTATLDGTSVKYTTSQNDGPDRYAYFKIHESTQNVYSDVISFRQVRKLATYKLVSSIEPGKHYVFASAKVAGTGYGMSSQGANNRGSIPVDITIDGTDIIISEDADGSLHEFVISGNGTDPNYYTIYDVNDAQYLFAASSSNNYLRSQETNDDNGKWTASFSSSAVTFTAHGSNTNNKLYYNSGNKIFSCYSNSNPQQDVYLYVKVDDTDYEFYSNTTSSGIANGETYTVHSPAILTLDGVNYGTLIIEDGGQLVTSTVVSATVKKSITGYGDNNNVKTGWNFIASPITEAYTPAAPMTSNTYDLYQLDPATDLWENYKDDGNNAHPGFNLTNGSGYLYANSNDVTLEFAGTIKPFTTESGANEVPLLAGWNLVGNPYTFNVYSSKSYYKITTENDVNVVTAATNDAIAPCTGIVVKSTTGSESVAFTTTAPDHSTGNPSNIQMTLSHTVATRGGSNEEAIDNAIVSFNEGTELEKFYFGNPSANIYIPQNQKDFAIVSANAQGEMPVNFVANENGTYTLTVSESLNSKFLILNYLHLIDNMTGADVDLLVNPSYTFDARTTDYASRFRLLFSANGVEENENDNQNENFAYINNGEIVVNGTGTVQLIDALGRILLTQEVTPNSSLPTPNYSGVYVLRLVGEKVKTQKIVVK